MDFQLNIFIDTTTLVLLKAGNYHITIAKEILLGNNNIIWVAIDPFEYNNISWNHEFGIFGAPNTSLIQGAKITSFSTRNDIEDRCYYHFEHNIFKGPFPKIDRLSEGQFGLRNQMSNSALTFGLMQRAIVNGQVHTNEMINANIIPAQLSLTLEPSLNVYIWLQAAFNSGTIINRIPEEATKVRFDSHQPIQSLRYNPSLGKFF